MMGPRLRDVSALLADWSNGNEAARDELMPLVYDELRRLAGYYMALERKDHSLQATALVNEACLRLIEIKQVQWQIPRALLRDGCTGHEERGQDLVALDDALKALEAVDPRKCQVREMRFFGGWPRRGSRAS